MGKTTMNPNRKRACLDTAESATCDTRGTKRRASTGQVRQGSHAKNGTAAQETEGKALATDGRKAQANHDVAKEATPAGRTTLNARRGHKRMRSTSPTEVSEETGGVKKRRISSTAAQAYALGAASRRPGRCVGSRSSSSAARVHDPGAASRRKRSCKASSASSSSGRYRQAFGAAARTGRLSLKKRGRGAPEASE